MQGVHFNKSYMTCFFLNASNEKCCDQGALEEPLQRLWRPLCTDSSLSLVSVFLGLYFGTWGGCVLLNLVLGTLGHSVDILTLAPLSRRYYFPYCCGDRGMERFRVGLTLGLSPRLSQELGLD